MVLELPHLSCGVFHVPLPLRLALVERHHQPLCVEGRQLPHLGGGGGVGSEFEFYFHFIGGSQRTVPRTVPRTMSGGAPSGESKGIAGGARVKVLRVTKNILI